MPIRPLAEMTWEEVRAVHAKPWIVLLPIGGVRTDHRGDVLRFGPAPYLTDGQLRTATDALREAVEWLAARTLFRRIP